MGGGMGGDDRDTRDARDKKRDASRKPKAIDSLLEEMKAAQSSRQAGRSQLMAGALPQITIPGLPFERDNGFGSKDDGNDPNTTNLYVGNLHTDLTEEMLFQEFQRFGTINSVKIMWPRTEEEHRRSRNCGFVSFTDRPSADKAKDAMDGKELLGVDLRIGWSKAVKITAGPASSPAVAIAQGALMHSAPVVLPQPPLAASTPLERLQVAIPADARARGTIDRVAKMVAANGFDFEALLMEKEHSNPRFAFLFEVSSPEHLFFKWRAWALANGDTSLERWREEPFQMVTGGPLIVPPRVPPGGLHSVETRRVEAEHQAREDRREDLREDRREDLREDRSSASLGVKHARSVPLKDEEYDELSDLLRATTMARKDVSMLMMFALDHAESSGEIIDTISEALCLAETAVPTKLARLYVVSDILHNTNARVKNASSYRQGFQAKLKPVMQSFHGAYKGIQGRVSAKAMRDHVIKVLECWDRWSLYPPHFIQELVSIFVGSEAPAAHLQPLANDAEPTGDDALDGEPLTEMVEMDGNVDGEPLDVDGEPLDEQGSPTGQDEASRQENQQESTEGQEGTSPVEAERKRQKVAVASKWNDD